VKKKITKQTYLYIFLFLLLTFFYFSFVVTVSQDSTGYYKYLDILKGTVSFKEWDIIRGPVMPVVLLIIFTLFGNSVLGFLIGTYLFYLALIYFLYKIISMTVNKLDHKITNIIWTLFALFVVFNPLIIGYYHALLTEFIATTIAAMCLYYSIKILDENITKKYRYGILLFFSIITPFMWLLKQPYVFITLIIFSISNLLFILKNRSFKRIITSFIAFFVILTITFTGVSIWNMVLEKNHSKSTNNQSSSFVSGGLIAGVTSVYKIGTKDKTKIISLIEFIPDLNDKQEQDFINYVKENSVYNYWSIYYILNVSGNQIKNFYLVNHSSETSLTISETLKFYKYLITKHPEVVASSYYANYLATCNVYTSVVTGGIGYRPIKVMTNWNHENDFFGLMQYKFKETTWWKYYEFEDDNPNMVYSHENMSQFEKINKPNIIAKTYANATSKISLWLFRILFMVAPLMGSYIFIKYMEDLFKGTNKHLQKISEIIIILYGFSFLYTLFFSLIGSIIDRYIFPAYPAVIIATILLIEYFNMYKNGDVNEKKS
jgi:hypothetical protein